MLSYQRMVWPQCGQRERGVTIDSCARQARDADVEKAAEEQAEKKAAELEERTDRHILKYRLIN